MGNDGSNVLPPFLVKTYEMVDDHSSDSVISWSQSNKSFVVWNPPEFARDFLPIFFKHNNFSSFSRQLNTYGFRKIDPEQWEFANEDFVLVVANPANTNALILKEFAPSIPEKNITCLTRLDHNRALGQISERIHVHVGDVKNVIIWGNDSSTQYPDVNHATVSTGAAHKPVRELVGNLTGGGFGFSSSNFNVCGSIMCGGCMDNGYTYMDLDFNLLETSSLAFSIIVTAFTLQKLVHLSLSKLQPRFVEEEEMN
ncbi:hypothetical protein HYC85_032365 [Camellia sinensis]|uniref:HSF-type DNA-binding domain-containing protein n=1 Tax=Camellia sinensis TaxID=4442 RepID=A0A7J7FT30_CAMSI|nr:hypothetical protein HYC85_032365 [Camellia sinensis]